jgi:hypothetical protein
MSYPHSLVIKNFSNQKRNKDGELSWNGFSIFSRKNFLYSWGKHHPLAIYLGRRNKKPFAIKNSDRPSKSTSRHTGITASICRGPKISKILLENMGFSFEKLTMENVIYFQEGFWKWCFKKGNNYYLSYSAWHYTEDRDWYVGGLKKYLLEEPWNPPKKGKFFEYSLRDDGVSSGSWRINEATVLFIDGKYIFCYEESSKEVIQLLPKKPKSIENAFELIKPKEAGQVFEKQAGLYFVPSSFDDEQLSKHLGISKSELLRGTRKKSVKNINSISNYRSYKDTNWVKGKVTNKSFKTLNLGTWHQVYETPQI